MGRPMDETIVGYPQMPGENESRAETLNDSDQTVDPTRMDDFRKLMKKATIMRNPDGLPDRRIVENLMDTVDLTSAERKVFWKKEQKEAVKMGELLRDHVAMREVKTRETAVPRKMEVAREYIQGVSSDDYQSVVGPVHENAREFQIKEYRTLSPEEQATASREMSLTEAEKPHRSKAKNTGLLRRIGDWFSR